MTTDFASLLDDFRPAAGAAPTIAEWEGPVPPAIVAFVEKCYLTGPQERKLTDLNQANDLQSVIKAACDQHDPKLSARVKRTYAPLVVDGVEQKNDDGTPVDDVTQLRSIRISVSKYSVRGGGKKDGTGETPAAAPATEKKPAAPKK